MLYLNKGVDTMEIQQKFIQIDPNGPRTGSKRSAFLGVTIHTIETINAEVFSQQDTVLSFHYIVDDTSIIQLVPETEIVLHTGKTKEIGNLRTIAIGICVNETINQTQANDLAATLTAKIIHSYRMPSDCVYQHNRWTKEDCPYQLRHDKEYDWSRFVSKVKEEYIVLNQ